MKTIQSIISGTAIALAIIAGSAHASNAQHILIENSNSQVKITKTERPVVDESKYFQTGKISGDILNIRFYRGNKIPPHIQNEIGKTYSPDFFNYTPYVKRVVLANGKVIPVRVTDLPIYLVAQMVDGTTQTQILYPKN